MTTALFYGIFLSQFSVLLQAQTDKQPAKTDTLRVLNWNLYLLPQFVFSTQKVERSQYIAAFCLANDYHVLALQETFHHAARRKLNQALKAKYPYKYGPANRCLLSPRVNSGLTVWSQIPLKPLATCRFKRKWGFDNRMARKGAQLLEGVWGLDTFQILNTHLNAGGPFEVRLAQMQQMWSDLLAPYQRPGVPQIVCGDMNTNRYDPPLYAQMLETLQAEDGPLPAGEYPYTADSQTNAWQGRGHHFQEVIDYVLLRPQGRTLHVSRQVLAPQAPLCAKRNAKRIKPVFDLSDHYAVEARIVFR